MSATSQSSGHRITSAEKLSKAIEARREGCSLGECAERAGYSTKQAVSRALLRHFRKVEQSNFAEASLLRVEEIERLDFLLQGVWPEAQKGNLQAVDRVIAIIHTRCSILGLRQPRRMQVDAPSPRRDYFDLSRLEPSEIDQLQRLLGKATGETTT